MKTILRISAISLLLAGSALALTGERMPPIPLEKMTPAQRTVADAIMAGPRGGMRGPFNTWLRLFVWLLAGWIIYRFYGSRHSTLQRSSTRPPAAEGSVAPPHSDGAVAVDPGTIT